MTENYKEVYFNQYCKKCEFKRKDEHEDPCDECLSVPCRIDSHKPINFKEREKK